jgi:hypothetical protein
MIFLVIFGLICIYFLLSYKFTELNTNIEKLETTTDMHILYLTDSSPLFTVYSIFSFVSKYIVDVNDTSSYGSLQKRLHKLSGHLLLVINFTNVNNTNIQMVIKSLSAYVKLDGNTLSTYVPYKANNQSSNVALLGKNVIMGNYAVLSGTSLENITSILGLYYGNRMVNALSDKIDGDKNTDKLFACEELQTFKLNGILEKNVNSKINKVTENNLKQLMEVIDSFFKFF